MSVRSVSIDGIRLDAHSRLSLLEQFARSIAEPADELYVGFYAALLRKTSQDAEYARLVSTAEHVYADGAGTALALRVLGDGRRHERLATTDIWRDLVTIAADSSAKIALVASNPEPNAALVRAMRSAGAEVVRALPGHFADEGARSDAARDVRNSGATVVFVGMGAGAQEAFCREVAAASPQPRQVFVTIGGLADHVAGTTRRAPAAVQRAGFEWAWRVAQEPRRLFARYALGNSYFLARLAANKIAVRR